MTLTRTFLLLLLVPLLLGVSACDDDATTPNDRFRLLVRVADRDGNPVPDLDLLVLMDSPFYQDGLAADKAAVAFGWDQPVRGPVNVTIEDAAGELVRQVVTVSDTLPAGRHQVVWNGTDDEGVHQTSGLYWAHLVAFRADTVVYDRREPMYMALMDFDRTTQGTTDAAGEILLTDKRLFPLLYGQVDMQARNENGEIAGEFPLVPLMRFYLLDRRYGHVERFDRDVTRSGQTLVLDWMGVDAPAAAVPPPARSAAAPRRFRSEPPDTGFRLIPPYPNPFN